jgi:4'-phosphopantetheinyl transferase EntD
MIGPLVPNSVVAVEVTDDVLPAPLYPAEAAAVARAVPARRREFATGRVCARRALALLGRPAVAIGVGSRGDPRWPAGVVGSITHTTGYRACAAALSSDVASIGIDAEVHQPLPPGVLAGISSRTERARLTAAGDRIRLDTVLFSAKEAVFKAWYPLTGQDLGFEDAEIEIYGDGSFRANLRDALGGWRGDELRGRWSVTCGRVLTTLVIPRVDARATAA